MKVAIIGTFGAQASQVRGPQRVAQELALALLRHEELDFDLYELIVPRQISHRFFKIEAGVVQSQSLPNVCCFTPRACLRQVGDNHAVVHFLGTLNVYTLALLYKLYRTGIPTIATLNGLFKTERQMGYPYSWIDVWAEAIGLRYVSRVVAVSESFRQMVEKVYPICRGKITAVEHGVPQFVTLPIDIGLSPHDNMLLCAGGTHQVKGIPFLLDALVIGWPAGNAPHLTLVGPPGDQHGQVLERARALGNRFAYLGETPTATLAGLYQQCRVYIQPSKYESFGMTILEAMAYGKPVIVTRECGVASLITDGDNGFTVDYGDLPALVEKIRLVLSNQQMAQRIGKQAFLTAQKYTWDRAACRYVDLYTQVRLPPDLQSV